MIDRETAIQWAKDAGAEVMRLRIDGAGTLGDHLILGDAIQFQALITRAIEHGRAEQLDAIARLELKNRMIKERNEMLEREIEALLKRRPAPAERNDASPVASTPDFRFRYDMESAPLGQSVMLINEGGRFTWGPLTRDTLSHFIEWQYVPKRALRNQPDQAAKP